MITTAEIDISALLSNFDNIKKKVSPAKVMAVVKANAYGHGIEVVSRELEKRGSDYFGVSTLNEGLTLRRVGISIPILLLTPLSGIDNNAAIENDLEMTVISIKSAKEISEVSERLKKTGKIHIKIDTGMGRIGINWQEALDALMKIASLPYLEIVGLLTHFATSDKKDKSFAELQLERFNQVIERLTENKVEIPLKYAANSGAVLDMKDSYFDMVRPGIMLYGYYPSQETSKSIPLKPIMTLKSKVIQKKKIKKGTSVGYGRSFITEKDTVIVTVPIGYAHGYRRALSKKGEVLIRGKRYPIVGTVCMDWIMVDVKDDGIVNEEDEVVLFGRQGNEYIGLLELCEKLDTIPYEILSQISVNVPRIYINR